MTTVLITGAEGYLGKHLVREALEAGHHVLASLRDAARADEVRSATGGQPERLDFVTLDLESDTGWNEAASRADAMIHAASPVVTDGNKPDSHFLPAAVGGTERALEAAASQGVTRVVMTSSISAILRPRGESREKFGPDDWTDPDAPGVWPYMKSKTLAEKAAWRVADRTGLALTTILPSYIFGAPLDRQLSSTLITVQRLLQRKERMLPKLVYPCVDVRDVAEAHLRALTDDGSVGQRIVATGEKLWFADVARIVAETRAPGAKPPPLAPDFLVRLAGFVNPMARLASYELGRDADIDNRAFCNLLGRAVRPPRASIAQTARYLLDHGLA